MGREGEEDQTLKAKQSRTVRHERGQSGIHGKQAKLMGML